jgi:hypothetical protein
MGITLGRGAAVALLMVSGLSGCRLGCDTIGVPALQVDVRDAATGQPLAWRALLITVRETGRADTASLGDGSVIPADTTRLLTVTANTVSAGTYTVIVRRPGYREWVRRDVRVDADNCGQPKSRRLEARLDKSP